MENMPKKLLDFLRDQFPLGSRIMLTEMKADPQPLLPGSTGTLNHIDEAGQFHILWDSGISMALIPGADHFQVLPQELLTLKLYMPLTADFYEADEYGLADNASELGGEDLVQYAGCILNSLINERLPEEAERGIMHWYGESDTVDTKVRSVVFTAEIRDNRLWGVAECRIVGKLSHQELEDLKEYITGQAADGWGNGLSRGPFGWMTASSMYTFGTARIGASRQKRSASLPKPQMACRRCVSPFYGLPVNSSASNGGIPVIIRLIGIPAIGKKMKNWPMISTGIWASAPSSGRPWKLAVCLAGMSPARTPPTIRNMIRHRWKVRS